MGSFESFLNMMTKNIGGGGEEPKSKNVYTSQDQINKDNDFVRKFLTRKGAPSWLANNSVVARNIGDPVPQFVYSNGKPTNIDNPNLQTTLPNGIGINDVFQTKDGTYGYMHPQQGTFIQVDPQAIYGKYGGKK